MNSKESRDSLTRVTGRTGTHDSRPLDLDLVVQIYSHWVLIGGVHAGSDGSGGFGRGAAAERAGGMFPRPVIAGDGQSGVPVAGLDRGLALEHIRGTRRPLGHSTGRCGAGSLELGDDGGSGRRGLAGASVLGDARGYGLRERAQKKEGFGA